MLVLPEAAAVNTAGPIAWPHDDLLAQAIQQWDAGRQIAGATAVTTTTTATFVATATTTLVTVMATAIVTGIATASGDTAIINATATANMATITATNDAAPALLIGIYTGAFVHPLWRTVSFRRRVTAARNVDSASASL